MPCKDVLSARFSKDTHLFAFGRDERVAGSTYLKCCIDEELTWADVAPHIKAYLEAAPLSPEGILRHFENAKDHLLPWLG